MNLSVVSQLPDPLAQFPLPAVVGVDLRLPAHSAAQTLVVFLDDDSLFYFFHHLIHGGMFHDTGLYNALVVDGLRLIFRQIHLYDKGVHCTCRRYDQIHTGLHFYPLFGQLCDITDTHQHMFFLCFVPTDRIFFLQSPFFAIDIRPIFNIKILLLRQDFF